MSITPTIVPLSPDDVCDAGENLVQDKDGVWYARFDELRVQGGFLQAYWNGRYVSSIRVDSSCGIEEVEIRVTGLIGFGMLSGLRPTRDAPTM